MQSENCRLAISYQQTVIEKLLVIDITKMRDIDNTIDQLTKLIITAAKEPNIQIYKNYRTKKNSVVEPGVQNAKNAFLINYTHLNT